MNRILLSFLLLASHALYAKTVLVCLGETPVKIIVETARKKNPKTLVHLHENETTALKAAKKYLQREGGTVLTLQHGGTRNIVFYLDHTRYEVDPNRIFTNHGIELSMKQFGTYSIKAHQAVAVLAHRILKLIPPGKVIAVHNNRDYSLKEYFAHQPLHQDASAVHYLKMSNYHNFYFVTQEQEYNRLKNLDFNVALQADSARDDGSLSYYLSHRNYINIEAAYGALKTQLRMLYDA